MGSLGGELTKEAMWLYPKIVGFNPSERWGHSACYSHGLVYVFGGCCGGLHFRDVLVLNLDTMSWSALVTKGKGPGPRDSHSALLWGNKMVVFGGTNGSKKVNDLHILDLGSSEWTEPICMGNPPSPRESHTATLVGDDKLVIFGGSGEGLGNYLNDLHVLNLKTMTWISPAVKGDIPSPRDSHTSVAVGHKLFLFGGDSGDRYHGEVYRFDVDTSIWSRVPTHGYSPDARAGHAGLSVGAKIYLIGGVGDKKYYNDVWSLDTDKCVWSKLDICGQQPQGRFSHSAIVAGTVIAIYGGCGEDERPLREFLILQLGNQHPNGRYNVSLCKSFGRQLNQEKKRPHHREENGLKATMVLGVGIEANRNRIQELHPKRRRTTSNSKTWELASDPEEHSLSVSLHSSPSQSDQEQATVKRPPKSSPTHGFPYLNQSNQSSRESQSYNTITCSNNHKQEPFLHAHNHTSIPMAQDRCIQERPLQSLIGAEVQGKVDGAFDSGFLMTAVVNGRVFRGVLFAPVPSIVYRRAISSNNQMSTADQPYTNSKRGPCLQPLRSSASVDDSDRRNRARITQPYSFEKETTRYKSDLEEGVVLTLGVPSTAHG